MKKNLHKKFKKLISQKALFYASKYISMSFGRKNMLFAKIAKHLSTKLVK